MNPKTLIIIPTYNERENIERMLTAVHAAVPDVEILVVDDGSPDGTGDLVEARGKADPRIHLLRRSGKLGLGSAYLAGFAFALERDYQRIFEMDADFSHDPKYLQPMLDASESADMVIGSRYVEGGGTVDWGLSRRLISRGGGLYARTILGLDIQDLERLHLFEERDRPGLVLQARDHGAGRGDVLVRHVFKGGVGEGGIEQMSVSRNTVAHRTSKGWQRPCSDTCRHIWCQVGGVHRTEGGLYAKAAGVRLTLRRGMTADTISQRDKLPAFFDGLGRIQGRVELSDWCDRRRSAQTDPTK
jgi:hypothetical protein